MPLLMEKEPEQPARSTLHLAARADRAEDGTRQLLRAGAGTLAVGVLAALLTRFVFGGIGPQGAHTNSGWQSLLVAMGCLPFGSLLFLLGAAKWMRKTGHRAKGSEHSTLD